MEALLKLGIDPWNILLYLINLFSIILVLTFFLYKPLMQVLDKRRKQIADSIEEAKILRDEFSETLEKSEAEKVAMERKLRTEMESLKKFIEEKRSELTKEMEESRSEIMAKAKSEIDTRKASIMKEVEKETIELIKKIVLQIVQNKVPETVIRESIKEAWESYKK